jgi:hypothetical protein
VTKQALTRVGTFALLAIVAVASTSLAQTITLPRTMPAFNQAYTEGPGAWGNCPLGTVGCPDQICTTGCLITAFSAVLAYYEIDVAVPARSSCTGIARAGMDPGIFNDWLRDVGGYGHCTRDPVGNCCLIWEELPGELEITTHENRSEVGLSPISAVVIDHALRQGYPVVAGVHWGASCSGGSGQSEDCHWVILTGKRDDTYTIVDPYNPDPTSPNGVRTTLEAGVHGSYIIDRFVVVAGPTPGPITLEVKANPAQGAYEVGDRLRISLRTPGRSAALWVFARVTQPSGAVAYAVLPDATSRTPRTSETRQSIVPDLRILSASWTWLDRTFTEADIGHWAWEIWVESPDEPGIKLGRQTISYDVEPTTATPSIGAAVLGILLVVAIAVVAFVSTLGTDLK